MHPSPVHVQYWRVRVPGSATLSQHWRARVPGSATLAVSLLYQVLVLLLYTRVLNRTVPLVLYLINKVPVQCIEYRVRVTLQVKVTLILHVESSSCILTRRQSECAADRYGDADLPSR